MRVMKFGGTSVGTPTKIREVANLITVPGRKIVVLSAMAGTTNDLVSYAEYLYKKEQAEAQALLEAMHQKYVAIAEELFQTNEFKTKSIELINSHFDYLTSFNQDLFTRHEEKAVLAQGELISTALMHFHLWETGFRAVLLPALNFMRIDKDQEPDNYYIRENLKRELASYPDVELLITQGFICRNAFGEIDNLKRGGSDYTASIIGAAADAEEIQIWTDIDGFHNNDPRYVSGTRRIDRLSFDEAAELAYFGAKILHPTSVRPAKEKNIPVRLKNTMNPASPGTLIAAGDSGHGIKAVAAKDGITAIRIQSDRMLLAFGFLRKVFEIFESYRTPIDMIATSEVSVSMTIDQEDNLREIASDLKKYGKVEVVSDQSIICVVGDMIAENSGMALRVLEALRTIPIRMISYGSSNNNISLLIRTSDKIQALNALSNHLFNGL
ncbi:MAG: aspartate kinase [Bacteroidales bacterium]|nr:aspartate kinase [Bacteroidales bacterium]